jgi:four helix bundle protein
MFRFQKFDVWHRGIAFTGSVYQVRRRFPNDERFGLTSQMRRSAVSVPGNVAEGSGRFSDRDFARFLEISYGPLMETLSHATVALNERFIEADDHARLFREAEEISRMLSGLRAKLLGTSHTTNGVD